tara:strand:+ start:1080 stop:1775 length:696 start_codon:yes stop_codon:yes gene_type:complete
MIKLALIGKSIQHSKSQDMYEQLLNTKISYDLLDYPDVKVIPSLDSLFSKYEGVSVTSPYKPFFLDKINLTPDVEAVKAINCLAKNKDGYWGYNTDLLAIEEITNNFFLKYRDIGFYILGDGVMGKVVSYICGKKSIPHKVLSRKNHDNFSSLSLLNKVSSESKTIIVNCCSRNFIFNGEIDSDFIFWDLNYSFKPHKELFLSKTCEYIDGLELLNLQAKYALSIWGIKKT